MITLKVKFRNGDELSGQYDTFGLCAQLAEIQRLQEMQEGFNIVDWQIS